MFLGVRQAAERFCGICIETQMLVAQPWWCTSCSLISTTDSWLGIPRSLLFNADLLNCIIWRCRMVWGRGAMDAKNDLKISSKLHGCSNWAGLQKNRWKETRTEGQKDLWAPEGGSLLLPGHVTFSMPRCFSRAGYEDCGRDRDQDDRHQGQDKTFCHCSFYQFFFLCGPGSPYVLYCLIIFWFLSHIHIHAIAIDHCLLRACASLFCWFLTVFGSVYSTFLQLSDAC